MEYNIQKHIYLQEINPIIQILHFGKPGKEEQFRDQQDKKKIKDNKIQ